MPITADAEIFDLLRIDRGDRLRGVETAARDARAGDDDFLGCLRLGVRALRARQRGRYRRCENTERTETRTRAFEPNPGHHGNSPLPS